MIGGFVVNEIGNYYAGKSFGTNAAAATAAGGLGGALAGATFGLSTAGGVLAGGGTLTLGTAAGSGAISGVAGGLFGDAAYQLFTKGRVDAGENALAGLAGGFLGGLFGGLGQQFGPKVAALLGNLKNKVCPPPTFASPLGIVDRLAAGATLDANFLTKAGRALQKHGSRPGSVFPRTKGTAASKNAQGQQILEEILTSNNQRVVPNSFGGQDIHDIATGRGV